MMGRLLIVVIPLLAFTNCTHTTLSKEECMVADWYAIGVQDGAQGYTTQRIHEHAEACKEVQKTPDQAKYTKGWNQGLLQYCDPANGYRVGLAGDGYHGLCPAERNEAFLAQFNAGREIYRVRAEYKTLLRRLESSQDEVARQREELYKQKDDTWRDSILRRLRDAEHSRDRYERQVRLYEFKHHAVLVD